MHINLLLVFLLAFSANHVAVRGSDTSSPEDIQVDPLTEKLKDIQAPIEEDIPVLVEEEGIQEPIKKKIEEPIKDVPEHTETEIHEPTEQEIQELTEEITTLPKLVLEMGEPKGSADLGTFLGNTIYLIAKASEQRKQEEQRNLEAQKVLDEKQRLEEEQSQKEVKEQFEKVPTESEESGESEPELELELGLGSESEEEKKKPSGGNIEETPTEPEKEKVEKEKLPGETVQEEEKKEKTLTEEELREKEEREKQEREQEELRKREEREKQELKEKEEREKQGQARQEKVKQCIEKHPKATKGIEEALRQKFITEAPKSSEEFLQAACAAAIKNVLGKDEAEPYATVLGACFPKGCAGDDCTGEEVDEFAKALSGAIKDVKDVPDTPNNFQNLLSILSSEGTAKKVIAFCGKDQAACDDAARVNIAKEMAKLSVNEDKGRIEAFKELLSKVEAPKDGDLQYITMVIASPKITDKYYPMVEAEDRIAFIRTKLGEKLAVKQYMEAVGTEKVEEVIGEDFAEDLFNDVVGTHTQADELGYAFFSVLGRREEVEKLLELADTNETVRKGLSARPKSEEDPQVTCDTMESCITEARSEFFIASIGGHSSAILLKILDPIGTDLKAAETIKLDEELFEEGDSIFEEATLEKAAIFGVTPDKRDIEALKELTGLGAIPEAAHVAWQAIFKVGHGQKGLETFTKSQQDLVRLALAVPSVRDQSLEKWAENKTHKDFFDTLPEFKDSVALTDGAYEKILEHAIAGEFMADKGTLGDRLLDILVSKFLIGKNLSEEEKGIFPALYKKLTFKKGGEKIDGVLTVNNDEFEKKFLELRTGKGPWEELLSKVATALDGEIEIDVPERK